jgi:hypothetical protein
MALFNRSPYRCRACSKRFYVAVAQSEPEEVDDESGEEATHQA